MKTLTFCALLLLPLSTLADPPPTVAPDADALKQLLNEFLASADKPAMHERFWADELIYTRSAGQRLGKADVLRLNTAIPPTANPRPLGLVGGDPAGFPNGRRVFDDVVAIELKAVAGATIPLVDPSFTPDGAAGLVTDGTAPGPDRYQDTFPYLGTPHDGYDTPSS